MNCIEVASKLQLFIDEELLYQDMEAMRKHLSLCLGCDQKHESEKLFKLTLHDSRALARAISIVENEAQGYEALLSSKHSEKNVPVIGITGPPGAGKSTLISALITHYTGQGKRLGIIAVDPTSPFNFGSLL